MKLTFWKMHGAQNDFVLFDDREGLFPSKDLDFIRHVAARHTGIGSEGVLLIQPSKSSDFRMRFFNPDGGEVDMCGNGARCIARLAYDLGAAKAHMSIETAAGEVRAHVTPESVRIWMTVPTDWDLCGSLDHNRHQIAYGFVNTGVQHVVMRTENLEEVNVLELGSAIRRNRAFAPMGTNANFMQVVPDGTLRVRTYERGVEAETPACGTGVTACGLIAAKNGWVSLPVQVETRSGDFLEVNATLTEEGAEDVTLSGPAVHVFNGTLDYALET